MNQTVFLNLESKPIFTSNVRYESGFKAPSDVKEIIMGLPNIKYKPIIRHTSNKFWGVVELLIQFYAFYLFTKANSTVIIQYPMVNIRVFKRVSRLFRKFHTIAIVHDLQSYRYPEDYSHRGDEVSIFNSMSCLIVHTKSMKEELEKQGVVTKMVVLGAFDYILPLSNAIEQKRDTIVFAGGLAKSKFLSRFGEICTTPLKLYMYGASKPDFVMGENMEYKGSFLPGDVSIVEGEWGLVWDGDSIDSCTGNFGEYLKLIAPHKLSLYIACGLKLIVWDKSAMAEFVKENNIGIVVESLTQIPSKISLLSDDEAKLMTANSSKLSQKVREGEMLKHALQLAFSIVNE